MQFAFLAAVFTLLAVPLAGADPQVTTQLCPSGESELRREIAELRLTVAISLKRLELVQQEQLREQSQREFNNAEEDLRSFRAEFADNPEASVENRLALDRHLVARIDNARQSLDAAQQRCRILGEEIAKAELSLRNLSNTNTQKEETIK